MSVLSTTKTYAVVAEPVAERRFSFWGDLGIFFVLLALSALYTFPLWRNPANTLADTGDPLQHVSIGYWTATRLLSGHWTGMWGAPPFFYPDHATLTYGDPQFGTTLLGLPIFAATRNPVLAYNVPVLISIPLCAFGAYLLARHLTKSRAAGFLAALIWGFGTWHNGQATHQQLLSLEFLPFLLLALHRYGETRKARYLVALGLCWLFQEFMAEYWGGFLLLLIAPVGFLLLRVSYRLTWREIGRAVVGVGLAVVPWLAAQLPLLASVSQGHRHSLSEVVNYSADLADYLPTKGTWLWGKFGTQHLMPSDSRPSGEFMISPGWIALLLAALVACWMVTYTRTAPFQETGEANPTQEGDAPAPEGNARLWRTLRRTGPYLMGLCAALWGIMLLFGVTNLEFLYLPGGLVNNVSVWDGFWFGSMLWLNADIRGFLHRNRYRLRDSRSPALAYIVLAALAMIWSCGYEVRLFGTPMMGGLHGYLTHLPGTRSFRALCRMGAFADLALAILAAYGFTLAWKRWITPRQIPWWGRCALYGALCLLILAENVPRNGTVYNHSQALPPPRRADLWLAQQPDAPLLSLPLTVDPYLEGERLWQEITHHKPMRNGCETFYPRGYYEDVRLLGDPRSAEAITRLRALGIHYVVLETDNRLAGRKNILGSIPRMPSALPAPYVLGFDSPNVKVYTLARP